MGNGIEKVKEEFLWKTMIYLLVSFAIHYLERLIEFWRKAGGFVAANEQLLAEIVWPHFWALQIVLSLLILIYVTSTEMARVLGRDRLLRQARICSPSRPTMDEKALLGRITHDAQIFGGKPIIRGHRLAVEHVLGMLAAGDILDPVVSGYPWMEREDVLACLAYSRQVVGHD